MFSVLILTRNEEKDLPGCLQSVAYCDDVHVFDSFSNDKTIEIAEQAGAHVTQRKFDGYASQRNAALTTIKYKYPWVFVLDADERMRPELLNELKKKLENIHYTISAFRIRRRDYMNNVWLKHAQLSPWYIRAFRPERIRYRREINEIVEVDGKIIQLKEHFDHYPFSKGLDYWIQKHNRYAEMEAQRRIEERNMNLKFSLKKAVFSKDIHQRRYHQKGIFYRMPARPFLKWIYMMFIRGAFLDGKAGLTYAKLQVRYENLIVYKTNDFYAKLKREMKKSHKIK